MKARNQFLLIIIASSCFLHPEKSKAQSEIGIKGGILFSNINSPDNNSNVTIEKRDGVVLGAFYKKQNILGPVGVQTEILYQQKGANFLIESNNYNESGYSTAIIPLVNSPSSFYRAQEKLNYLTLPVMLDINATKFLDVYAGPEVGYLVSQKTERQETDELSRFSAGVVMGATLKLCENTHLDFRYATDFTAFDKLGKNSTTELKNRGFTITIRQTITIKQSK